MYSYTERIFEKIASAITAILGNSITFIIALVLVIFWLCQKQFAAMGIYDNIRDVILGATFLSLFIIQKSFNRFSGSLHLKVNELVSSHEPASNAVINIENKTEQEINELSKGYAQMAEAAIEKIENEELLININK